MTETHTFKNGMQSYRIVNRITGAEMAGFHAVDSDAATKHAFWVKYQADCRLQVFTSDATWFTIDGFGALPKATAPGIALGQAVAFDHAVYGPLTGVAVKVFANGKVQVQCETRISGDVSAIRKTTYNIPANGLRFAH